MIYTDGDNQNSYVTLDEANAIALTEAASFMEIGEQLTDLDTPYLLAAFRDLEQLWEWAGQPTDYSQPASWPRRYVQRPGFVIPCEPGWWGRPYDALEWLQFKWDYLTPGRSAVPFLDEQTVPQQIKAAQVLIAILRKKGKNLVGDNQGDSNGMQLDVGFKVAYVNPIRDAADIHSRLAGLGTFLGDSILRVPNV